MWFRPLFDALKPRSALAFAKALALLKRSDELTRILVASAFLAAGLATGTPLSAQNKGGGKTPPPPPPPNINRPICFWADLGALKTRNVLRRADVGGTSIITVDNAR